jgi:hypothetical protein
MPASRQARGRTGEGWRHGQGRVAPHDPMVVGVGRGRWRAVPYGKEVCRYASAQARVPPLWPYPS